MNNIFYALGLTTKAVTKSKRNHKLFENPQKSKKGKDSYIRNGYIRENKSKYASSRSGFCFSSLDKPIVKSIIRNSKKKIKQKK